MNSIDILILAILLISTGISFLRGFVREVLSLVAWISAVWIAISFTPNASVFLSDQIINEPVRVLVSFVGLFLATLIVVSIINFLIGQLVKKTGFSGTDRMIGVIFGLARGGVIVSVIVLIVGVTTIPQEKFWQESMFLTHFSPLATWLQGNFPKEIATQFAFDE